jgi:hypothetical protein
MASKKTWAEKLNDNKQPKVKRIDFDFAGIPANSNMFIATPKIIDTYIKQIDKGKKVSPQTIRKDLAIENKADYTCPVSTGIFLRIVAEAAYEKFAATKSIRGVTPFWRVVEPNSALAKKLSFGQEFIIEQRKKENIKD